MTIKKRKFEDLNGPTNALASMLDDRQQAIDDLNEARYAKLNIERSIKLCILEDTKGFEDLLTVNWRRLYCMFGDRP